jgi:hypothetical protein
MSDIAINAKKEVIIELVGKYISSTDWKLNSISLF